MILDLITTNLLWTEGRTLLLFIIAGSIVASLLYRPLMWALCCFFLFSFWFFRNPERVCPERAYDKQVLTSPADGKVVAVEFGDFGNGFTQKVAIFLSVIDAHVQWAPTAGIVQDVIYKKGAFTFACLPKSSTLNERNDVVLRTADGNKLMIRQIAGTIARRICCWVSPGDTLQAGQRFGMIRFGSRVELFLPPEASLSVGLGQYVLGGQTVLGHWQAHW